MLEDYEDLLDLRSAKREEHLEESIPLEDVKREFGL